MHIQVVLRRNTESNMFLYLQIVFCNKKILSVNIKTNAAKQWVSRKNPHSQLNFSPIWPSSDRFEMPAENCILYKIKCKKRKLRFQSVCKFCTNHAKRKKEISFLQTEDRSFPFLWTAAICSFSTARKITVEKGKSIPLRKCWINHFSLFTLGWAPPQKTKRIPRMIWFC